MIKKRILISMSADLLLEPILYRLVKDFDLIPGVRKADVNKNEAWMTLELQGESEERISEGIGYLMGLGASVKSLDGDFLEG